MVACSRMLELRCILAPEKFPHLGRRLSLSRWILNKPTLGYPARVLVDSVLRVFDTARIYLTYTLTLWVDRHD